jgi:hypothetical protein
VSSDRRKVDCLFPCLTPWSRTGYLGRTSPAAVAPPAGSSVLIL